VKLLVEHGADVGAVNRNGRTPSREAKSDSVKNLLRTQLPQQPGIKRSKFWFRIEMQKLSFKQRTITSKTNRWAYSEQVLLTNRFQKKQFPASKWQILRFYPLC